MPSYIKEQNLAPYIDLMPNKRLAWVVDSILANQECEECLKKPSSSSGMHHPQDELGEWGQLIHAKKVVNLSLHAAHRYDNVNLSIVIAAALLHDVPDKFFWDDKDNRYRMNPNHALDNADYIESKLYEQAIKTKHPEKYEDAIPIIQNMIAYHMGKWCQFQDPWYIVNEPIEPYCSILQQADYFASRKNVSVDYSIEECKNI